MTNILKTFKFVFLVCALPLAVTAVLSAQNFISHKSIVQEYIESIEGTNAAMGQQVDLDAHVSHALIIDAAGGVSGQVFARGNDGNFGLPGMKATLNFQGQVVAESMTTDTGEFRFDSVSPGAYTFIANSENSITTFGVYVYANEAVAPAANDVQLTVAAAGMNTEAVRNVLNSEVQSVSYGYTPSQEELPFARELSQVRQTADGSISGRVVPLQWLAAQTEFNLQGNQVYLFNESGMVHQASVDADGFYSMQNVNAGIYDFVSFGPHGAAALSVEVTAHDSVASTSKSGFSLASARTVQDDFGVVLGEPVSGGAPPPVDVEVIVNQPEGGGFPGDGGYGGGGGGGVGGMGDFGSIIGMALAAWVLTEAIDNDDFNDNNNGVIVPPVVLPPVVSPFN